MSDWGDDFEQKHFRGDFVGTVLSTPKKTAEAMSDWGDAFERQHFDGDFAGAVARTPAIVGEVLAETFVLPEQPMPLEAMWLGLPESGFDMNEDAMTLDESMGSSSSSSSSFVHSEHLASGSGGPGAEPGPATGHRHAALATVFEFWSGRPENDAAAAAAAAADIAEELGTKSPGREAQEIEMLQAQLDEERTRHTGRAAALVALEASARALMADLEEDRRLQEANEVFRAAAVARATAAARSLEALTAHHQLLLEHQEAQLAEKEQHDAAAAAAAAATARAAELEGRQPREWARDGPETDALKQAKLELAEVLGETDEARLQRRKEMAQLLKAVQQAQVENSWLLKGGPDRYQAPGGSFTASLWRLFTVAAGRQDPYASLDT